MKTTPKTRPSNVTSFILEGRWPLAGFDQRELRRLSKTAKRNGVGVADVLYEAVESFVAKCEAEADLEEKVIKFPTVAKRWLRRVADSSSRNAVSFSSACTTKRFPSSRCASTIQNVRPSRQAFAPPLLGQGECSARVGATCGEPGTREGTPHL